MFPVRSSNRRASPVWTVKLARGGLAMVMTDGLTLDRGGVPTCAQGSSVSVTEFVEIGAFWGFWVLQWFLCKWRVLVYPFMSTESGLRRCAYRRTRALGGGRWRYYLRSLAGTLDSL